MHPWVRAADGSAQLVLTKPFSTPAQVAGIMREISGTTGPLRDVTVTRDRGLFSTTLLGRRHARPPDPQDRPDHRSRRGRRARQPARRRERDRPVLARRRPRLVRVEAGDRPPGAGDHGAGRQRQGDRGRHVELGARHAARRAGRRRGGAGRARGAGAAVAGPATAPWCDAWSATRRGNDRRDSEPTERVTVRHRRRWLSVTRSNGVAGWVECRTPSYGPVMRTRTVHRCSECGGESPRWLGRCPACDAWGTLVEEVDVARATAGVRSAPVRAAAGGPLPIGDVDASAAVPVPTGVDELDRVLDGGLVPGSVTLLGGEPGMGKSTLLLQALGRMAGAGATLPARHRRGVVRAGADAGRARRRARSPTCSWWPRRRCPHVLAHVDAVAARGAGGRLDPDRRRSRPPRRARVGHPGARLRVPARAAGQGARAVHRARRPRHQGGHARRPARARAHGRHRAVVRRRPRPLAAAAARAEAPVRRHRTSSACSR